jgi:adenosine deaminase
MRRRAFLDLLVAGVAGYAVRPSIAISAQPVSWHERLPKVELHLHLEGAIPKATLWELITKYGGDAAFKTREDLERALVYRDFRGFLKMWVWMTGYLREYDDYTLIGEAVARDLARQNIRYVEGFFSPPDYRQSRSIRGASQRRCGRASAVSHRSRSRSSPISSAIAGSSTRARCSNGSAR